MTNYDPVLLVSDNNIHTFPIKCQLYIFTDMYFFLYLLSHNDPPLSNIVNSHFNRKKHV